MRWEDTSESLSTTNMGSSCATTPCFLQQERGAHAPHLLRGCWDLEFLQAFVWLNRAAMVIVDVSLLLRSCSYPFIKKKKINKRKKKKKEKQEENGKKKKWKKQENDTWTNAVHVSLVVSDSFELAIEWVQVCVLLDHALVRWSDGWLYKK